MKRGDIVDYTLVGTIDMPDERDGFIRARPAKVTRPAIVIEVHDDGTADLHVFVAEPSELPNGNPVRRVPTGERAADAVKATQLDTSKTEVATKAEVGTFSARVDAAAMEAAAAEVKS